MSQKGQSFADNLITLMVVIFLFVVLGYALNGEESSDPTLVKLQTMENEAKVLQEIYEEHLCRLHAREALSIYERLSCDDVGRPK